MSTRREPLHDIPTDAPVHPDRLLEAMAAAAAAIARHSVVGMMARARRRNRRRLILHAALTFVAVTATGFGVALFLNLAMTGQWLPAALAAIGTAGAGYWTGIEARAVRKYRRRAH